MKEIAAYESCPKTLKMINCTTCRNCLSFIKIYKRMNDFIPVVQCSHEKDN